MRRVTVTICMLIVFLFSALPAMAAGEKQARNWQDESIYYIMIDRFNDGNSHNKAGVNSNNPLAFNGGDFQGIIDKLDYIKDMGFTTILLTPIFDTPDDSYHGYKIRNFYKTDEHFGSLKTFQKLVKEAHKRNLKVMVDFVANNVSPTHPWVKDPNKQTWFHPKQNGTTKQGREDSWISGLPDLNQDNPEVKKYLIGAAKWWIKKTDIDGYHLVDVNAVPIQFWTDFSREIKNEKNNFYLLGDLQIKDPGSGNLYKNTEIDGVVNPNFNQDLRIGFAATDKSLSSIFSDWSEINKQVKQPYLTGIYLDNPFSTRFTKDIVVNKQFPGSRWKMALTYLYTSPGIPIVFYGSEIALNGGQASDNHRQMNFRTDKELIDYITKLGQLRQQLPSLTKGSMIKLYEKNGMIIYKRIFKKEIAVVAINNTKKSQQVSIPSKALKDGKELRGLLNGDLSKEENHQYQIILDRDKAEVYVLADKSGMNIPLMIAIAAVYILFFIFLYFILKRRKKRKSN